MSLQKILIAVGLVVIGLVGFFLIFTSGRIEVDPFNIVLFVIVGGLIIYFYIFRLRNKE